jgi:hypothetical protein
VKPLPISIPVGISRPANVVGADSMLQSVVSGINGVKERISGLDLQTTPASFIGPTPGYTFQPETTAFSLDVNQSNVGTSLVNYIVRSGTTYSLPVIIGGNGVFLAHKFRINLWQRLYVNGTTYKCISQAPVAPMVNTFFPAQLNYWTTKFSLFPLQPEGGNPSPGGPYWGQNPSINYRWNIQDPVTGFNYSDNLLPASALLQRNYLNTYSAGSGNTPVVLCDGDWHEFDAPWRFDKAYQINVLFRPVTDIVQFDSSVDISPSGLNLLDYDDRIGGLRNQAVTVQVEFQGERIGGR